MKKILFAFTLLFAFISGNAQHLSGEQVEWKSPAVYKARQFTFKTPEVTYVCNDCEILEIKSISGITGYLIVGNGTVKIKAKNISEQVSKCMLRFNPSDLTKLIETAGIKPFTDAAFIKSSEEILEKTFRHCYHSGMAALIPEKEAYAINFFSDRLGEILASFTNSKVIYFNFTTGKEL